MDNLEILVDSVKKIMYRAGETAVNKQAGIANISKNPAGIEGEDEFAKRRRNAKTQIDVEVQEILLKEIARVSDPSKIYLDAEESTPFKNPFSQTPTDLTLIIDPIDGTLEYIEQRDDYCITVGFIKNGVAESVLVYFPKRKQFYSLRDGKAFLETNGEEILLKSPTEIKHDKVYVNNRVPEEVRHYLTKNGFQLTNDRDINWLDGLIGCLKGEYRVCIFHTPQSRDVLLGSFATALPGGYMKDWQGNDIKWPNGGRIPQAAFGFGELPQII